MRPLMLELQLGRYDFFIYCSLADLPTSLHTFPETFSLPPRLLEHTPMLGRCHRGLDKYWASISGDTQLVQVEIATPDRLGCVS
jgi:hypothetical protein